MRFLKRAPAEAKPETPTDFWSWWSDGRNLVAEALAGRSMGAPLIEAISRAVRTIHPAMAWELAPGRTAEHAFCISPEGNAELRQVALRWMASAPAPDATWEYYPSRQASPTLRTLGIGDRQFDLEAMRAITSWDPRRRRLDVRLWHPAFDGAPDALKLQAGFLFLDNLLGEDDVERWVGSIDLLEGPTGGRTPAELQADLERHTATPVEIEGATWILGERTDASGRRELVLADAALKRIDHPFADRHVTIRTLFGHDRLPTAAEADALNAEEDDLLGRLGDVATFAGRVTGPGARTLHFVAEDPDLMRPAIDGWAADIPDTLTPGLPQRRLKINFEADMDWAFQRELGVR